MRASLSPFSRNLSGSSLTSESSNGGGGLKIIPNSITLEGFLGKEKSGSITRRYFVLVENRLYYGDTKTNVVNGKHLGVLDLREATVDCNATSLNFSLSGPYLNRNKKGKVYVLVADTFEDMRSWTSELAQASKRPALLSVASLGPDSVKRLSLSPDLSSSGANGTSWLGALRSRSGGR